MPSFDIRTKTCFVFDLEGTVYRGDDPVPGTVDFIQRNLGQREIFFLTNNTSKNLADYASKLARLGIEVGLERILSPLQALIAYLREQGVMRIYPVGNSNFQSYLKAQLPDIVFSAGDDCQAVVLACDAELNYVKMTTPCLLLKRPEVRFLSTRPACACPSSPSADAFVQRYHAVTGRLPAVVFGKPSTFVLAPLLKRFRPEEVVMVGDRLCTDQQLAQNAGIDFILVLSGEAQRKDLLGLGKQPSLVVEHLGAL